MHTKFCEPVLCMYALPPGPAEPGAPESLPDSPAEPRAPVDPHMQWPPCAVAARSRFSFTDQAVFSKTTLLENLTDP